MAGLLDWFNANSGALTALSTIALTMFTLVYVALTHRLVHENAEMRKAMIRPDVSLMVAPHDAYIHILMLTIENLGGGPALRIKFDIDWQFERKRRNLREIGPFRNGLSRLAPRQRIETFLETAIGNLEDLKRHPLSIKATYFDMSGEEYRREFIVDFAEFEGIEQIGQPPLFEAADELKKIREKIERLTASGRLQVAAYSLDDLGRARGADNVWHRFTQLSREDRQKVIEFMGELKDARSNSEGLPRENGDTRLSPEDEIGGCA